MPKQPKSKPVKRGLVHIYVGDGKGKTTAVVGLAVRASGAGKRVLFAQFVKAAEAREPGEWPLSSEIVVLKSLPNISVRVLGRGFVGILGDRKRRAVHRQAAVAGLRWLRSQVRSRRFDLIVADELVSAVELKLLSIGDVLGLMRLVRPDQALALTGHTKYTTLLKVADLVTEMKMIKHPYYKGIIAQRGIDF